MITLISSYALRSGTDREEFTQWARSVDIPATRARPGVHRFEMYIVTRDDAVPKHDIVELFEIESEEVLAKLGANPSPGGTTKDWERFADPRSARDIVCRRID